MPAVVALIAKAMGYAYHQITKSSSFTYVPFSHSNLKGVLVTDCTAPASIPTLTHHKVRLK